MLIACLGWGSLVWEPRDLPVRSPWFADGPFLPIEFARQSDDGRITLVLVPGKPLVRTLWALLSVPSLRDACEALYEREGMTSEDHLRHIGVWTRGGQPGSGEVLERVEAWARPLGLDGVVWTALPPHFRGDEGRVPSAWEVVAHLDALAGEARQRAEEYLRRAPRQIDTEYRRYIEQKLGWRSPGSTTCAS
jgi:hypothetical protein